MTRNGVYDSPMTQSPKPVPSSSPAVASVAGSEVLYADVLGALDRAGYDAHVADLGGGCVVIYVPLDTEDCQYLTVAGQACCLPADRGALTAWTVQEYDNCVGTEEQAVHQYPASDGAALVAQLATDSVI